MLKLCCFAKLELSTFLNRTRLILGRGRRVEDTLEKDGKTCVFFLRFAIILKKFGFIYTFF